MNRFPRILLTCLAILAACTTQADPWDSPEALLAEKARLETAEPCDLTCHIAIADLYTERFLEQHRDGMMPFLENQATRREMMMQMFGETFDIRRVRQMSPQEYFGRILWGVSKRVPPEYLMRTTRITSKETAADGRVRAVVLAGGMAADPDYEEEGILVFIKTGRGWRIDNQH